MRRVADEACDWYVPCHVLYPSSSTPPSSRCQTMAASSATGSLTPQRLCRLAPRHQPLRTSSRDKVSFLERLFEQIGYSQIHSPAARSRTRAQRISPVTSLAQESVAPEVRKGPVTSSAWQERDSDGQVSRACGHDASARNRARKPMERAGWGSRRVVRNGQSGGFHRAACGIIDTDHLVRLLLVLAIAYQSLVRVGRWVVQRSYRQRLNDGASRQEHVRRVQLGLVG
jgi:hypothetical protein